MLCYCYRMSVCVSICDALQMWMNRGLCRSYLNYMIGHGSGSAVKKQWIDIHNRFSPGGCYVEEIWKKITILTSISQCRSNDTRYGHSYNAICRMVSFPMTLSNPNLDSKVQITWKLYEITHSGFAVYLPGLCGLAG